VLKMIWTKDADAQVLELWEKGVPARLIGEILGTSKGSVIGRHRRLTKNELKGRPVKGRSIKGKTPKNKPILDAHPAFDPVAGVWFLGNIEAKSVSELLEKLPKGSTIKDYFQTGYAKVA
jgi:hypothetical protein